MQCTICGGSIEGDGFSSVRRCEFADVPSDVEPDADVIFCGDRKGVQIDG